MTEEKLWGEDAVKNASTFEFDAKVTGSHWEEHPKYGTYLILQLVRSDNGEEMPQKYRYTLNENGKFMRLQRGLLASGVRTKSPEQLVGLEFHWKRADMEAGNDPTTGEKITSFVMVPTKCLTPGVAKAPTPMAQASAPAAKASAALNQAQAHQQPPVMQPPVVSPPPSTPPMTAPAAGETAQEARIMALLKEAPMTISELSEDLKISEEQIKGLVNKMLGENKVREKKGVVTLQML